MGQRMIDDGPARLIADSFRVLRETFLHDLDEAEAVVSSEVLSAIETAPRGFIFPVASESFRHAFAGLEKRWRNYSQAVLGIMSGNLKP
jgi:hypothetical protein